MYFCRRRREFRRDGIWKLVSLSNHPAWLRDVAFNRFDTIQRTCIPRCAYVLGVRRAVKTFNTTKHFYRCRNFWSSITFVSAGAECQASERVIFKTVVLKRKYLYDEAPRDFAGWFSDTFRGVWSHIPVPKKLTWKCKPNVANFLCKK